MFNSLRRSQHAPPCVPIRRALDCALQLGEAAVQERADRALQEGAQPKKTTGSLQRSVSHIAAFKKLGVKHDTCYGRALERSHLTAFKTPGDKR